MGHGLNGGLSSLADNPTMNLPFVGSRAQLEIRAFIDTIDLVSRCWDLDLYAMNQGMSRSLVSPIGKFSLSFHIVLAAVKLKVG